MSVRLARDTAAAVDLIRLRIAGHVAPPPGGSCHCERVPSQRDAITVVLATPLAPELRQLITDVVPRVTLLVDDDLLPPQRFPGDHSGDPGYHRSAEQQAAFESLLAKADVLY